MDSLKIDKMAHHIESINKEMFTIKEALLKEKAEKELLHKKSNRRSESLKKAQKKFKNISTNFKGDIFKKIEKRVEELALSKSAYIKALVQKDLQEKILETPSTKSHQ